jgi:hypothetical protein
MVEPKGGVSGPLAVPAQLLCAVEVQKSTYWRMVALSKECDIHELCCVIVP